jgi:hypothetical protein
MKQCPVLHKQPKVRLRLSDESGISGPLNENGANERCSAWIKRRGQFLSDFGCPIWPVMNDAASMGKVACGCQRR